MSKLTLLLNRINKTEPELKPMTEEDMAKQDAKVSLIITRVENRRWRLEAIQGTLARLESLHSELEFIRHVQEGCEECMVELALDVERYFGSHSGIWYLDLSQGEDFLPEYYSDCPKVTDYRFGSYWDRTTNYGEIKRFILDRMKWAKPLIQEEIYTVIEFYLALEQWDLESELPPYTSDDLLFQA